MVTEFKSVDDILDFAIKNEEAACAFYTELSEKMTKPAMVQMFKDFAREEEGHKAKLLDIKSGKLLIPSKEKVLDLKIADYIDTEIQIKEDLDYADALVLAMRKEKQAFKLYTDLASRTDNEQIKTLLLAIAQEEAKHKLRFELEYDEIVLTDN